MLVITISGREFDRDSSSAKRAAKAEPVFITEQGNCLIDCLGLPEGVESIDIEFPSSRELADSWGGGVGKQQE